MNYNANTTQSLSVFDIGFDATYSLVVIGKEEMEALEAKNMYLMRKVVDNNVRDAEERWSRQQLLEILGLESIEEMIRKKKLQWVAHSGGVTKIAHGDA